MKEKIREALLQSGAGAIGFAKAGEIDPEVSREYEEWIGEGCHGEMAYLERHIPLRRHTDHVLPEAETVISLAFSYAPRQWRDLSLPTISAYAYGEDYHLVLRDLLNPIVKSLKEDFGGKWRICIDSAPVAEKYWAVKSGVGVVGLNGAVITQEAGSLCFLVEILTTLSLPADAEAQGSCLECGACMAICPARAIQGDKTIDARKCINYLTIEKKSEFTPSEAEFLNNFPSIRGCDRCLRVCPLNKDIFPTSISRFNCSDPSALTGKP